MLAIMRQNLTWAVIYNLAAVPLAASGWLQPWMAAIGMSLSSLLVVLNALRAAAALARARRRPGPAVAPGGRGMNILYLLIPLSLVLVAFAAVGILLGGAAGAVRRSVQPGLVHPAG